MGDKGERGVKNLKKWVTSFMDRPIGQVAGRSGDFDVRVEEIAG